MTSEFIWQIGENWSILKVSKENNKLFANSKATAIYCVIGNSQMLPTDTVLITCTVNSHAFHKKLMHYDASSNEIIVNGQSVSGWKVVSNGEELALETDNYEEMTISFEMKRFSSLDGVTLLKSQTTGSTTENVYSGDSYTPMVVATDAEDLQNQVDLLNDAKQDKYDANINTTEHLVVGAINDLITESQSVRSLIDTKVDKHKLSGSRYSDISNTADNLTLSHLGDGLQTIGIYDSNITLLAGTLSEHTSLKIDKNNVTINNKRVPTLYDSTDNVSEVDTWSSSYTKNFVNSSIATNTANFKGTYNIVTDLGLTTEATESDIITALSQEISTVTNNDYCFVAYPNATVPTHYDRFDRYKYTNGSWGYEFTLNNSSFTAAQWAAINSGITSTLASKIGTAVLATSSQDLSGAVNELKNGKQDTLTAGANITINNNEISAVIPEYCLVRSSDPNTSTVGEVRQFCLNTVTRDLWQCVERTPQGTDPETYSYTWRKVTITNYVTQDTSQTISADKTFEVTYDGGTAITVSKHNAILGKSIKVHNDKIEVIDGISSTNYKKAGIDYSAGIGSNFSLLFPNSSGTFALTSDIPQPMSDYEVQDTVWESLYTTYTITTSVTNGTYVGNAVAPVEKTAVVVITADTGYELPSSVTVTNATANYNSTTGEIEITNPTGNVTISVTCQAVQE